MACGAILIDSVEVVREAVLAEDFPAGGADFGIY
jgi:hypothetical protein